MPEPHQSSCLSSFSPKDYVISRYVAEFVNTFSSLVFGALVGNLPSRGPSWLTISHLVAYGIDGLLKLQRKQEVTVSRAIPYFGLVGVGVCSAGYHMTLKYRTQMCQIPQNIVVRRLTVADVLLCMPSG
jgi:dihydroceramidase